MRIVKIILLSCGILLLSLLLLEWCYRYQIIDFYSNEYEYFNDGLPEKYNKTILFFGDSFTAQQDGYVDILKRENTKARYVNSAIPGTGIVEMNLIEKNRIENTPPDAVILQIYPANDLTDIAKPINWKTLSFSRNFFWTAAQTFHILNYFNYKLGQASDIPKPIQKLNPTDSSESIDYNYRSKLYIKANPKLIGKSIHLNDSVYSNLYKTYEHYLEEFIKRINPTTPLYLIVVPHCSQIADNYYDKFVQMGAELPEKDIHFNDNYEFCKRLFSMQEKHKNVKVVNMMPYIRKYQMDIGDVYFSNDPHLNSIGNRTIADILGYLFVYDQVITY